MEKEMKDTCSVSSVFDVWETCDRNWNRPHYPSYPVATFKIGSALSLGEAERIVLDAVRREKENRYWESKVHSLRVVEITLGRYAPQWDSLSEHIYDTDGHPVDGRTISAADGVFPGRGPDELRFAPGDLCEVLENDDEVYLGIVAGLPPDREKAAVINRGAFHLETIDDSYVVLRDRGRDFHVNSLRVFPPRHRISPRTEARLRDAYNDYVTLGKRMGILDTAAAARLESAALEQGWTVSLEKPCWENDTFKLMLREVPGFPDGLDLQISQKMAWNHMDRVVISFKRLAGKPAGGRGYRLKRIIPPKFHIKGMPDPDPQEMYHL